MYAVSLEERVRNIEERMKIPSCSRRQSLPSTFESSTKKSYDLRRRNTQTFSSSIDYSHHLNSPGSDSEAESSDQYEPDSSESSESDMDVVHDHEYRVTSKNVTDSEENDESESEYSPEESLGEGTNKEGLAMVRNYVPIITTIIIIILNYAK